MNAVETIFLKIDLNLDKSPIRQASKIIKSGGLVAFPTETVYGLGAVMSNEQAVRNIYKAKGRPEDNPLILHIYKESQIFELTENLSAYAKQLIDAFCPGPLTLVAEKSALVPAWGTAGLDTVAIRMPGNPVALTLLEYVDEPVFAPSANTSGRPSPTRAEHVLKDLNKKIDCVLDGGSAVLGLESTVVDVTGKIPRILRPGYVTAKDIKSVVGAVELADNSDDKPKSPGTKYKHYAPNAEMRIVVGEPAAAAEEIIRLSRRLPRRLPLLRRSNISVLATNQTLNYYDKYELNLISLGDRNNLDEIGANLFAALRAADENADYIFAEGFTEEGVGSAIMNRLQKASAGMVIYI